MSAATALARGRALAETLMVDTCLIRRRTGQTTNPNTGAVTPTYTPLYTGKCRVQQHEAQGRTEDAGEDYLIMQMRQLQLPVIGTEGLQPDDEVLITASTNDPHLLGRVYYIRDVPAKTHATSRRLSIQERT